MTTTSRLAPARRSASSEPVSRAGAALVLALILTCQLMVMLDATIVKIALPKIRGALHFSPTSLSWVQNAYTLTFGGLLLLGARAGDILGRRRVFIGRHRPVHGRVACSAGSPRPRTELLAARAAAGHRRAPSPHRRPSPCSRPGSPKARSALRAIGLYSAVSSGGASVGLVAGGMLTDWAVLAVGRCSSTCRSASRCAASRRATCPRPRTQPGRFDLAGAITSTLGMASLVYGFVRAASDGWSDSDTVGSFVAGVVLLAPFVADRTAAPSSPSRRCACSPTGNERAPTSLACCWSAACSACSSS